MRRNIPGLTALAVLAAAAVALPLAVVSRSGGEDRPVADDPVPVLALVSDPVVDVGGYDGNAPLGVGPRLVAGGRPVELVSQRSSYARPIRTVWRTPDGDRPLPAGSMPTFGGLRDFFRFTARGRDGEVVHDARYDLCLNTRVPRRTRATAPLTSPYPLGCPDDLYNPLARGSVMGLQAGWSLSLTDGRSLPLPPGRYAVRVSVAPRYAAFFGIAPGDREVRYTLRVHPAGDGFAQEGTPRPPETPAPRPDPSPPSSPGGPDDGAVLPDLRVLPPYGLSTGPEADRLTFTTLVWNAGDGPLVLDGFRRGAGRTMVAHQLFADADGDPAGARRSGVLESGGPERQEWRVPGLVRYRLLAADRRTVVRSRTPALCTWDSDPVDLTLPAAPGRAHSADELEACLPGAEAPAVRVHLSPGWGTRHYRERSQSFDLDGLPNGTYYLELEANPTGRFVEAGRADDVVVRGIRIGGRPGARTVTAPPVGRVADRPSR